VAFAGALAASAGQRARSAYIAFFQQAGVAEAALSNGGLAALFKTSGHPGGYDRYVDRMAEPAALTAALNWYRAIDPMLVVGMGPVTTPTLFVWSTRDVALGREGAEATAARVEGPYRFEVLEGVSHWIPEEAPEHLNRLLIEHLAASSGQ
jgi:pimeloyl-ACP methyl ester carboxylesterase